MSCKDIGLQQTARMGGGAGRGKRVGNESTLYRVAYNTKRQSSSAESTLFRVAHNTKGQSPAVHQSMIESLKKVLPVGHKVEGRRDCSGARCTGRYLPF